MARIRFLNSREVTGEDSSSGVTSRVLGALIRRFPRTRVMPLDCSSFSRACGCGEQPAFALLERWQGKCFRQVGKGPPGQQLEPRLGLQFRQCAGGPQKELGGDAPPVEAGTAQRAGLHQGHGEPEGRGFNGGGMASGAGAQDNEITGHR